MKFLKALVLALLVAMVALPAAAADIRNNFV